MAYCIECGAKAPDVAKFCPQCGSALVDVEAVTEPSAEPVIAESETADVLKTETKPEAVIADIPKDIDEDIDEDIRESETTLADTAPSVAASLATAASVGEDEPKSKIGLFIGPGLVAVMAVGGGAYAMGLFDGDNVYGKPIASAPIVTTPSALPETGENKTPNNDPVLTAYQEAIKTGRISDLGQFAKDHPESSLAKDAEAAAFASLQRQGSVLAFTAFNAYFPEADTSTYTGPRVNADEDRSSTDLGVIEFNKPISSNPTIRISITQRVDGLDPFLAQGDTDYVLAVIDEMLSLTDLTESEATYLLNLRASAETSRGLITTAQPDAAPAKPILIEPVAVEITPAPAAEPVPEVPVIAAEEANAPITAYDTPAKPVERFGAITPDEATEPGECDMTFSVNVSGAPINITATCTDSLFIAPAKETAAEWVYAPALLAGAPVQQDDVLVKIRFNLE